MGQPGGGGVGFYFLHRNAIYKRVFHFTVGVWPGLTMSFYKAMEAREHRAPRSPRNIWQELFIKTGREILPEHCRLLLSRRRTVS